MEELKRIYKHFIDILIKASSELVKHWDKDTLNRAFAWAAYCQTVRRICLINVEVANTVQV